MTPLLARGSVAGLVVLSLGATSLAAQGRPVERLVTADGVRLEFPQNAVWRAEARRVAQARAVLRAQGYMSALNAPALLGGMQPAATAVTGALRFPTILIGYSDTNLGALPDSAQYDSVMYTVQPLGAPPNETGPRPYTVRTFYEEMSRGMFSIAGQAYHWIQAPNNQSYYLDACGTAPSNALDCPIGRARMREMFTYALHQLDSEGVNFQQYDGNGDGVVDLVQFVQPVVGGECNGHGIWAHHFTLAGLGGVYQTNDGVVVGPYQIIAGVGGSTCTSTDQIMGVGTSAHETGHGLNLPDLYDVSGATQGVGEWSLMGSGNYTSLVSPAHIDAWSKDQLGWVIVRELAARGTASLGPVVAGDTVMMVRPLGANPRGEYFLLENKQALGADTANMNTGAACGRCTGAKRGGLLVWHVDSLKLATNGFNQNNSVNAGYPHGLAVVQADDSFQLDKTRSAGGNRGDAGDPYPGSTANSSLGHVTAPAALLNGDSSFVGFALSAVNQDVANGAMSFTLDFATVIRPSDTLAVVTVSNTPYHRFLDIISPDSAVTVSVPSPQTSADGRAHFSFLSWSDGQAQTHSVTAAAIPDSLVAVLAADYQLKVTQTGSGTLASSPAADLAGGQFFPGGTTVTLSAAPGPDSVLDRWSGDTVSTRDTLTLTMHRPFTLSARFVPVLVVASEVSAVATMGASFADTIPVQGGIGQYGWKETGGELPPGVGLFTNGVISGVPAATGTFVDSVSVQSGSQARQVVVTLTVSAPVVALDSVVIQLLGLGAPLTKDQMRYFDLLGNQNQSLDLGDFLAWVKKTGVKPAADVMARVMEGTALRRPKP